MDRRVALIACLLSLAACDDDDPTPVAPTVAPAPVAPFVLYTSTPAVGRYVSVTCPVDGDCRGLSWTIHVANMPADAVALRALFFDAANRECAAGTTIYRRIDGKDAFLGSSFALQCELPFTTTRMGVQLLNSRREAFAGAEIPGVGWTFTFVPARDPS